MRNLSKGKTDTFEQPLIIRVVIVTCPSVSLHVLFQLTCLPWSFIYETHLRPLFFTRVLSSSFLRRGTSSANFDTPVTASWEDDGAEVVSSRDEVLPAQVETSE